MLNIVVFERKHENIAAHTASHLSRLHWQHPEGIVISPRCIPLNGKSAHELIVISEKAEADFKLRGTAKCRTLLIPDIYEKNCIDAENIIRYGMSSHDTLTFSSIGSKECVLSIQKEISSSSGKIIERQDFPIKRKLGMSNDTFLALLGTLLILGVPPELL